MDDFPADSATPEPRRPRLTVVIPVHNGAGDLRICLRRLGESGSAVPFEVIVVDDASTDGSGDVATRGGAIVIRHESRRGPAAARNEGVAIANAPLIFFVDADVAVHPMTIQRLIRRFDADPSLSALFGSYDDRPESPGLVSQYRNLLHHFVHQSGDFLDDLRPVRTFWTGCGAIRREVFLDSGGFDPARYHRPAIEDIEFGYRLTRMGHPIVLARDVQATHLKRWTFLSTVRTDIFQRGVPWLLLMKQAEVAETDLNVGLSGRISVAATGLGGLAGFLAPVFPLAGLVSLACLGIILGLNQAFYRFLARTKGIGFAVASVPLHIVYFGCCGLSVLIASAIWHGKLKRQQTRDAARSAAGLRRDEPAPPAPAYSKARATQARRSIR